MKGGVVLDGRILIKSRCSVRIITIISKMVYILTHNVCYKKEGAIHARETTTEKQTADYPNTREAIR